MKALVSHFGPFELDHTGHELRRDGATIDLPASAFDCLAYLIEHRDRPVSRDEIILAVWGRPDVSETLLGQTIARLRRELGDTGNEQHTIRTISRKGYRWVAPTRTGEPAVEIDRSALPTLRERAPSGDDETPAHCASAKRAPSRRLRRIAALFLLIGVIVLGSAILWRFWSGKTKADAAAANPALVLPSSTHAPASWDWLRLGVMDLIANRLRQGGQPTLTSDSVVSLLHHFGEPYDPARSQLRDSRLDATSKLRVQPSATLADGEWAVHLDVLDGEVPLEVDARSSDVLTAASRAADLLLVKLGHVPPSDAHDRPQALTEIVQRAKAATLAGNIDLARSILRDAPEDSKSSPELAWSAALVEAYAGNYEMARERVLTALPEVHAESDPVLRARMLTLLGAMYMRKAESEPAAKAYAEAIDLAENGNDLSVLSHAYSGRAVVEATERRYDEALVDFGRARVLSEKAGNVLGEAQIDMNVGSIMDIRGQPASAARTLEDAARRLRALSSQEEWAVALQGLAVAQLRLLDPVSALKTAESFSPPQIEIGDKRLRWLLALTRARALAANGRIAEAEASAQSVWDATAGAEDALFRANAAEALAKFSGTQGDWDKAARLAASALGPELERADVHRGASACRGRRPSPSCDRRVRCLASPIPDRPIARPRGARRRRAGSHGRSIRGREARVCAILRGCREVGRTRGCRGRRNIARELASRPGRHSRRGLASRPTGIMVGSGCAGRRSEKTAPGGGWSVGSIVARLIPGAG